MTKREQPEPQVWRAWVDLQRRVVSFHETEGGTLMEFCSYDMFMECIGQYASRGFRFQ